MRWRTTLLATAVLLSTAMEAPTNSAAANEPTREYVVSFDPGARRASVDAILERVGAVRLRTLVPASERRSIVLAQATQREREELSRTPGVSSVEDNFTIHGVAKTPAAAPDYLLQQWNLQGESPVVAVRAGVPTSYPATHGVGAVEAWVAGNSGSAELIVGVIDGAVDVAHPDLRQNLGNPLEIPGNRRDDDGNGLKDDTLGWNFINNNSDVSARRGDSHGTQIAGIIGATDGATGVSGVAPRVRMVFARVLDASGNGRISDAIAAVQYFTELKRRGANVVATNNSWAGTGTSEALSQAVAAAGEAGIVFVAAAGNGGVDGRGDFNSSELPGAMEAVSVLPSGARFDPVITVAAVKKDGSRLPSSNYGTAVDVGAPGEAILSTMFGGGVGTASGTSVAAPHATAAVVLWHSWRSGVGESDLGGGAAAEAIEAVLGAARDRGGFAYTLDDAGRPVSASATGGLVDVSHFHT